MKKEEMSAKGGSAFGGKKKIIISVFAFVAIFAFLIATRTKAGGTDNVVGWAWGGSQDLSGNGSGLGWISMNNVNPGAGGATSYGVNVPLSDGAISGSAWSENLGWISFNASDLGGCPASRVGNNLQGCARIMSIPQAGANAGGYTGWIHLSGTAQNGTPYGISITPATGVFAGYAWSEDFGAIDFSRVNIGAVVPVPGSCTAANGASYTAAAFDPLKFYGDPDENGSITVADATLIMGGSPLCNLEKCDLNSSGSVDIADALLDLRMANGLDPSKLCATGIQTGLSGTGPWNWTCAGTGGGANAPCSANLAGCTPTYNNYVCPPPSTAGTCNAGNAGQTVIVPAVCSRAVSNGCFTGVTQPTQADCLANGGVTCTDASIPCPSASTGAGGWIEVAP